MSVQTPTSAGSTNPLELRVLVLAPTRKDAELCRTLLGGARIEAALCADLSQIAQELLRGAAALLLTEEALAPDQIGELTAVLARQEPWSDLPILVLTHGGAESPLAAMAIEYLGNVVLLERPVLPVTLLSTVRAAVKARQRQYQLREYLAERQRTEEALRESNARLKRVLEIETVGVMFWDVPTGRMTDANDAFLKMMGYNRHDMEAGELIWQKLTPPEFMQASRAEIRKLQATGRIGPYEKQYLCKDGTRRWLLLAGTSLGSSTGVEFCVDITDRKLAEAEAAMLRERLAADLASMTRLHEVSTRLAGEEDLRALLEGVVDAARGITRAEMGNIQLFDEATHTLTIAAQRGFTQPFLDFFNHVSEGEAACGHTLQRGSRIIVEDVEHSPLYSDAARKAMLEAGARAVVTTPLVCRSGRLVGMLSVHWRTVTRPRERELQFLDLLGRQAADFIERTQTERAMMAAKHAAEEASHAKDQFLAVLSHELRTPLTPVIAAVSLLQEGPQDEQTRADALEMIHRNAELEARLIDDLLDVTRIARGKIELDRQPTELCQVIRHSVEVCREELEARQLHFGVDLGPAAPYLIDADAGRLQQVFWNLLKNAIKFTPHGGCVGIRCRRDEGQVITEVIDSGEGIEPHLLPHIFNAFEQGGARVTRQFGGLGLGLTITKGLVELHGGTIEAFSAGKGKGATFTVRLPIITASPVATPDQKPPAGSARPMTNGKGPMTPLRILLVEDHGDTAKVMRRLLSSRGYQVETAGDVATALDLAEHKPFDLLLSDLGLPDGSGIDLMCRLRELGRDIPGIALSGFGQEEDIRRSKEAGFAAHLTKPTNPDLLTRTIGTVVHARATG